MSDIRRPHDEFCLLKISPESFEYSCAVWNKRERVCVIGAN